MLKKTLDWNCKVYVAKQFSEDAREIDRPKQLKYQSLSEIFQLGRRDPAESSADQHWLLDELISWGFELSLTSVACPS